MECAALAPVSGDVEKIDNISLQPALPLASKLAPPTSRLPAPEPTSPKPRPARAVVYHLRLLPSDRRTQACRRRQTCRSTTPIRRRIVGPRPLLPSATTSTAALVATAHNHITFGLVATFAGRRPPRGPCSRRITSGSLNHTRRRRNCPRRTTCPVRGGPARRSAVAVDAVRRHPAERQATLDRLPHHLQAQLRLGAEHHRGRYAGFLTPRSVGGPLLGRNSRRSIKVCPAAER